MANKNFRSGSDEIKHYVVELLEDDKGYSVDEIREYVESKSQKTFTRGQLAGVLSRLVKSGDYMSTERGMYTKAIEYPDIKTISGIIFKKAIDDVMRHIDKLNVMDLTQQDFDNIRNIKDTIELVKKNLQIKE